MSQALSFSEKELVGVAVIEAINYSESLYNEIKQLLLEYRASLFHDLNAHSRKLLYKIPAPIRANLRTRKLVISFFLRIHDFLLDQDIEPEFWKDLNEYVTTTQGPINSFINKWVPSSLNGTTELICNPTPIPQKEETEMSKAPKIIETRVYVRGVHSDEMTDEQIFETIRHVEKDIESLNAIKNKPKKLLDRISEMESSIAKLAELVDARE